MKKPSQHHYMILDKIDEIAEQKDIWFLEDTHRHVAEFYGITTEEVGRMVEEVEVYEEAMAELEYNY